MRRKQVVEIDRLVLEGFEMTPGQAEGFRERVRAELQVLLERQGLPEAVSDRSISHLVSPSLRATGDRGGQRLATGVARSVAETLGRGGAAPSE